MSIPSFVHSAEGTVLYLVPVQLPFIPNTKGILCLFPPPPSTSNNPLSHLFFAEREKNCLAAWANRADERERLSIAIHSPIGKQPSLAFIRLLGRVDPFISTNVEAISSCWSAKRSTLLFHFCKDFRTFTYLKIQVVHFGFFFFPVLVTSRFRKRG